MDNSKIIRQEFEALRDDLISVYDRKGMRSSGNFEEQLEVRVMPNLGILLGPEYAQQLETGRKPGKFPPIASIEQWIYDKGIDARIEGEITVKSLAFIIARKISKKGWNRGGDVELISEVVTPQRISQMIDKIGEYAVLEMTTDIISMINELKT